MEKEKFLKEYVNPFKGVSFIYLPNKGFIVWRLGTGKNIEILHIKTFEQRKGYAKNLIKEMIVKIQKNPPYYSIFGFGLIIPERAYLKDVYKKLGFNITSDIPGPYKGGHSFIFYQSYENLKEKYSH